MQKYPKESKRAFNYGSNFLNIGTRRPITVGKAANCGTKQHNKKH
jgi:hypothetical protein